MRKPYAAVVTVAAAYFALSAVGWKSRSRWVSLADIDQWLAEQETELATMEPPPGANPVGIVSSHVARAAEPPHEGFPWFAGVVWTDFHDGYDGLRSVSSNSCWLKTREAAVDAVRDMVTEGSTPVLC